jgi:hypothetical protein
MLEIHPNYVLNDQSEAIAVQIPIEQFRQIEVALQSAGHLVVHAVNPIAEPLAAKQAEDITWLEADLSPILNDEPYDWAEGELNAGQPVSFVPGMGIVVEAS